MIYYYLEILIQEQRYPVLYKLLTILGIMK